MAYPVFAFAICVFTLFPSSALASSQWYYASSTSNATITITVATSTTLYIHGVLGVSGNGFIGDEVLTQDGTVIETYYTRQVGTGAQTTDNAPIQTLITPTAGTHTYALSSPATDYSSIAIEAITPDSTTSTSTSSSSGGLSTDPVLDVLVAAILMIYTASYVRRVFFS